LASTGETHYLRYGAGRMGVRLPRRAEVLRGPEVLPISDSAIALRGALRGALESPIGSLPLAEIIRNKRPRSAAITISAITRPVPNEPIVTALLEALNAGGVADERVVIVIGTGMHRPSTAGERRIMLGDRLLARVEVIDHLADDAASHVRVSDEPPVSVNGRFMMADLKIVTGLIEPHFMAGYSGGRKGVCPGLVDLRTVQRFHGFKTMGDLRSVEGNLEVNPCHEESLRVARLVGIDFLVNVAITHDREIAGVYAGEMEAAHAVGCGQVAERLRLVNDGLKPEVQRRLCVNPAGAGGDAGVRAQRFIDDYFAENPGARVAVIPEGPYTMLARGR
jgi:lactate racemase